MVLPEHIKMAHLELNGRMPECVEQQLSFIKPRLNPPEAFTVEYHNFLPVSPYNFEN